MLKFEHKRYLMEKDDIIVEIVLSAYCKAHYSCVDSCNFLEIISDLTLIRGNKNISALEHENQSFMNFLYIFIKLRFSWL